MGIRNLSSSGISSGNKRSTFIDTSNQLSDFDFLASYTVTGSSTSSFTFSNIPSGYKYLQLSTTCKVGTGAGGYGALFVQFNGDTGNNYYLKTMYSVGSTITSEGYASYPKAYLYTGNNTIWGNLVLDIYGYNDVTVNTSMRSFGGVIAPNGGAAQPIGNLGGLTWNNKATVTSITVSGEANTIAVGSTFNLFGIRG